jgi:hypothetical protein
LPPELLLPWLFQAPLSLVTPYPLAHVWFEHGALCVTSLFTVGTAHATHALFSKPFPTAHSLHVLPEKPFASAQSQLKESTPSVQ